MCSEYVKECWNKVGGILMTLLSDGDLAYLPQRIGFILGLYIAAVLIVVLFVNFLYCRNYQVQYDDIQDQPNNCILVSNEFFSGTSFESTYVQYLFLVSPGHLTYSASHDPLVSFSSSFSPVFLST